MHAAEYACPDEHFLCQDPGTLTCAKHNDCNGQGDCFQGFCYCFVGWGGVDCNKQICQTSCSDVRTGLHGFA